MTLNSTRETLKLLRQAFTTTAFPTLTLPHTLSLQIESILSSFAANYPSGGGGGHQRESEADRERSKWREGLLDLWFTLIDPLPGNESDPQSIANVSAFLVLLHKLSAGLGEDDDSALISRREIGSLWWNTLLHRTILGGTSSSTSTATTTAAATRSSQATARRDSTKPAASTSIARPLTVSRIALEATSQMIIWAMSPSLESNASDEMVTPFGMVVVNEYEERTLARMKGIDESYGLKNLEECLIGWASACPQAFLNHLTPLIALSTASHLPFLSLLLLFLSRHSAKSYHALQTPLLPALIQFCLASTSSAAVSIAVKCLTIFLVTLPVIIGPHLFGIMAVYGRIVSWDRIEGRETSEGDEMGSREVSQRKDGPPPAPFVLFTVLYGIYPCNFMDFLRNAPEYLGSKGMTSNLDAVVVRERSKPLIQRHHLHPSLVSNDLISELTDTNRWRRLESADVMAECDRNVAYTGETFDPRSDSPVLSSSVRQREENDERGVIDEELEVQDEGEEQHHRRARSRSATPHLPTNTHYATFQALQNRTGSPLASRSSSMDPTSLSLQLGIDSSATSSTNTSRRTSIIDPFSTSIVLSPSSSMMLPPISLPHLSTPSTSSTNAQIVRLETELAALKSEVHFQTFLKALHLAHMGTLHRAKVLDSGAEAERQSLYRTIRTLRSQLQQTKTTLSSLRTESGVTKGNWINHIDDLKEKVKVLREDKTRREEEVRVLKAIASELEGVVGKREKEVEEVGHQFFDLRNQVSLDQVKLNKITEYEERIGALIKTLSVCDEDICKYTEQRREMNLLVGEWKKSELLRESAEFELTRLRSELMESKDELYHLRHSFVPTSITVSQIDNEGVKSMRKEMERLRKVNDELREENLELKESS